MFMTIMGKVSIIIPTFNQVKYLATCVDHCLFQTYPKIEIIIVDGGSTDGTKDYLKNLRATIETQTCNPIIKMDREGNIIRQKILSCQDPPDSCLLSSRQAPQLRQRPKQVVSGCPPHACTARDISRR